MMNPDELEPPRPAAKPADLQPLSVGELQDYIESLKAEIARAEGVIARKQAHRGDIEALFGSAGD